jgi:hypothetical protein
MSRYTIPTKMAGSGACTHVTNVPARTRWRRHAHKRSYAGTNHLVPITTYMPTRRQCPVTIFATVDGTEPRQDNYMISGPSPLSFRVAKSLRCLRGSAIGLRCTREQQFSARLGCQRNFAWHRFNSSHPSKPTKSSKLRVVGFSASFWPTQSACRGG